MNKKARVIAFYLPQFHPIPENDKIWGKGFTEWTNVGKAKPLFKGHYQPRVPADLGYYDLRMPEVREAQAQMAKDAGVEGFMYWHYWFGNGRMLLEKPFKEVLESGKPDFPFMLGWANHSWTSKTWTTNAQYKSEQMIMEQLYPGEKDYIDHFNYVLPAFKDKRYITLDEKPIFFLYEPLSFTDVSCFINLWQKLALENGLKGIHFVGQAYKNKDCKTIIDLGFDAVCKSGINDAEIKILGGNLIEKILRNLHYKFKYAPLRKYDYAKISKHFLDTNLDKSEIIYPTVLPGFDHSARSGRRGLIYTNSTPALFQNNLSKAIDIVKNKKPQLQIVFLRSWNEWAEGNYVEPDLVFGHGYLNAIKAEVFNS